MSAEEYLEGIGFNVRIMEDHFNDDDKSYYTVKELLESYTTSREHKLYEAINEFLNELVIQDTDGNYITALIGSADVNEEVHKLLKTLNEYKQNNLNDGQE